MDESEKKMTDPHKTWFQMYNEERQKREALEAELDGYKQGAKLQAGIDWHQMYVDVLKEREQARDSLAEARKSMVGFHCSTFQNFPDDDHCGSPQARTCGSYYLCQAMKKVLGVGGDEKNVLGRN